MRLLGVLIGSLMVPVSQAISFQTPLEDAGWTIEGDQFECRLIQPVAIFGTGQFVRRAGEQAIFRLVTHEPWLVNGRASLYSAAAPWQPTRRDINLGTVSLQSGSVPFKSSFQQASELLSGLLEGRSPLVRHHSRAAAQALEVRLLPVRFKSAYAQYQQCVAKLLPVNFDQVKLSQLGFPGGGIELVDDALDRLEVVVRFLKADPTVNRVLLDGHSDNSGNRLTNRDLSRRRGLAVKEYLIAQGIPEGQITLRFHGEQYPLKPNNSAANRALNRRVTLRLERDAVQLSEQSQALDAEKQPTSHSG